MVETVSGGTRVARKSRRCWICQGLVVSGDTYAYSTNVLDGRIYTLSYCLECEALTNSVSTWSIDSDDGIFPSDYEEWAREHADEPGAMRLLERLGSQ